MHMNWRCHGREGIVECTSTAIRKARSGCRNNSGGLLRLPSKDLSLGQFSNLRGSLTRPSPSGAASFLFRAEPPFTILRRNPCRVIILLAGHMIDALAGVDAHIALDVAARRREHRLEAVKGKAVGHEADARRTGSAEVTLARPSFAKAGPLVPGCGVWFPHDPHRSGRRLASRRRFHFAFDRELTHRRCGSAGDRAPFFSRATRLRSCWSVQDIRAALVRACFSRMRPR